MSADIPYHLADVFGLGDRFEHELPGARNSRVITSSDVRRIAEARLAAGFRAAHDRFS